jgi:type I restriction enzyme S subunit
MSNYQLSVKKYSLYKDSGIEWLGDVPEHWEVRRVKDIVKRIGNGVTPRGGSEVYTDFGVVFLRSQNVYDDGLRIDNVSFIPEKIHEEMKSSQLETGDILINITGASIGRTCLFSLKSGSANINQHIAFLRTKFWINEFYISLFLKSHFIKNYIEIEQNGASKEAFNLSQIANIPLVLPSQLEQKSIATYLDTKTAQCDRKIDLLTQKATQYGKLKQSLINETVTRGLDKSVPMKDSDYEWNQKIPTSWQETRVKNIFKLVTDLAPNDNNFELLSLFASIGVKPRKDMEQRGNKSVTTDGYWMVKKGDIIVNKLLAWMGSIGLSDYDGVTSPAYDILRKSSEKVDQRFYTYLFRTEIAQAIFKKQSRGIMDVRLRLYFDKFGAISVPFPPPEEQKAIADYLDTKTAQIDQIIQTINTQIEKLKELRKTLINDVVTGKIRV